MKTLRETVDVLIIGGGTAGHIAAIQAGRALQGARPTDPAVNGQLTDSPAARQASNHSARVAVIEAGQMLGGTMTSGGVFMPNHFHTPKGPVVQGIPWEMYLQSREIEGVPPKPFHKRRPVDTPGYYSHINIPIYATLAEQKALEAGVALHYGEFVGEVAAVEAAEADGAIWRVVSYARGIKRITTAKEIIDASGDADGARAAGFEVEKAPARQPGTLQYQIEGIDLQQVWKGEVQQLYDEALAAERLQPGDWAYFKTYPFLWYLQMGGHNATHVYDCDTTDADGQTDANIRGRAAMLRMFRFVKEEIPGAERAVLKTMYAHALSREGYRVIGEHRISYDEFMEARTYPDQICNAFNYIDLHNEESGCEEEFHASEELIPKIPFRSLVPRGVEHFLIVGRIVSSERRALAGLRAQCTCMAMGQAAGAASALAVQHGIPSREVPAEEIVALTVEQGAVPV